MKNKQKQRGIAAIEFLVTVPVLVIIVGAVTEFGNAFIEYNTLNKMARNGARYATSEVTGTTSYDQIADETEIKNMVVYGTTAVGDSSSPLISGLTANDISIDHSNQYVTITINHTYTPRTSFLSSIFDSSGAPMNVSAVMRTAP
ncbi:pilus assembly protein [Vibrio sp. ZSDE26]|uniref:Pilus assembly protein n=1 Tax=Vibrio amylolyticus TaxID=2847292 RepID=A0A9X2BG33_9VIBR|nr:TadE family protein [Vibrio amylolyticus]MCK6262461.1 pilus assembly protein [Vibrio amylolyticus]